MSKALKIIRVFKIFCFFELVIFERQTARRRLLNVTKNIMNNLSAHCSDIKPNKVINFKKELDPLICFD